MARKKPAMGNSSNRLKELRKAAGLTQQEVADASGFSVPQISRWETGADGIPSSRLPILASAYRCSIGQIFDAVPNAAPATLTVRMDVVMPSEADLTRMFEELLRALPTGSLRIQAQYLAATLPSGLALLAEQAANPTASFRALPRTPPGGGKDAPTTSQD